MKRRDWQFRAYLCLIAYAPRLRRFVPMWWRQAQLAKVIDPTRAPSDPRRI